MELRVGIYTITSGKYTDHKSILLNQGEIDEMVGKYLKQEGYLKENEVLVSITYEEMKP